LSAFDDPADLSSGGWHLNIARFDRDKLGRRAQYQTGVHLGRGRNVNFHVLGNELFEVRRLYPQLISAHVDDGKRI